MPQLLCFRRVNAAKFFLLFGLILMSLLVISLQKYKWNLGNVANSLKNHRVVLGENVESVVSDLKRYKCQSMTRYGSNSNADELYRIDGDYFICNDNGLKLKHSDCIVLSFGMNYNDRFEENVIERLNCLVHSFDPYVESRRVTLIRNKQHDSFARNSSPSIQIQPNWLFHSLGITTSSKSRSRPKGGGGGGGVWLDSYANILRYVNMSGRVIDVLKLDTEGGEWDLIEDLMVVITKEGDEGKVEEEEEEEEEGKEGDEGKKEEREEQSKLLCDWVKQLVLETHPTSNISRNYHLVKSLERCFRLFRRDHRFFIELEKTEWQMDEFELNLKLFKDEVDLARFLFTYGELYFVNINYL